MARGWIARSQREKELEHYVEGEWGPDRQRRFVRRMSFAVLLIMMLVMSIFVASVARQNDVEESYAIVYSAPSELYAGVFDLPLEVQKDLAVANITLRLDIPAWKVHETRQMTYFNRTVDGAVLHYLRMPPLNGQVVRDTERDQVEFTLRIDIVTPNPEVASIKFLGKANVIQGLVTNHPDEPLVELTYYKGRVRLRSDRMVEVVNLPDRDDVEYWFLQFSRTRLS
jgi:hypothetical protein